MRTFWIPVVFAACHRDEPAGPAPDAPGEGLFAEGCPVAGEAFARTIGVDARLAGGVAVGSQGDTLLANGLAAYVITRPDAGSTYYYYGGIVADAAPMAGCVQTADDVLDEVGLVLGQLDFADFESSILRDFRADRVEVIADGSDGGTAIVRATGTDDMNWLVEYELIRAKLASGGRPLTEPFGLELTVDYALPPDSPVLNVTWTLHNPTPVERSVLTGALLSFAPSHEIATAGAGNVAFGGLSLTSSIPYLSATDGTAAFAYGLQSGNLGYTRIAGIDVAINLDQALLAPLTLPPGATAQSATVLAVGTGSGHAATQPLIDAAPLRLPGGTATATTWSGTVVDAQGLPVSGARVDLWGDGGAGFQRLDLAWTDATGTYALAVPTFSPDPWAFEVAASGPGRDEGARVPWATPPAPLVLGPSGTLDLLIEEGGSPVPARVSLVRDDGLRFDLWTTGVEKAPIAPGRWDWTVTRGFEYGAASGTVVVPDNGSAELHTPLEHVVDTAGWISIDTHVHSAFSPDSRMDPPTQVRHAAAHGLDVVLHTEHEHIVDQTDNPTLGGVAGFVASVIGEEMTATMPEHMTMFPVASDGTPRGGPIAWYGLDIAELFDAMHARSDGGINILNHPGYMDLIGWDYTAAVPTLADPTLLGLSPDAALWSWAFEGIEVMNGHESPFADGNSRFEKWQSLLNAGHVVFPAGCSDDHGGEEPGFPRTYVQLTPDAPDPLDVDALVEAMRGAQVSVSDGAFARVSIDGFGPGALVAASDTVSLEVAITAPPEIDVTHAVVFANCDEVAQVEATDPEGILKLDTTLALPIAGDTQIVVAAFGEGLLPLGMPQFDSPNTPRVLTGAIFVDSNGNGVFDAPGGRICSYDLSR